MFNANKDQSLTFSIHPVTHQFSTSRSPDYRFKCTALIFLMDKKKKVME